jgi:copper(I)-binding protein
LRYALLALCLLAGCERQPPLRVEHGWLRAPVADRSTTAGYFELINETDADLVLETARSAQAKGVELHTHYRDGDMMRMRRLDRLAVPSGGRVAFSPGSHHLMIFGLDPDAETVVVTLGFTDGTELSAELEWRSLADAE